MASHHLSLAKASFAASLLRPDLTKVSRDDLPNFHHALEAALAQCSSRNIQTCKRWLLEHVIVSPSRTTAFGKYLASLSRHMTTHPGETVRTSLARQRLHILYILNDLLHHATHHTSDPSLRINLTHSLEPFLPDLFQQTVSGAKNRVSRRLSKLVTIWEEEEYFERDYIARLHASLAGAIPEPNTTSLPQSKPESRARELPYLIPPTHGDPSLPFYDLPAGNLMRYIVPNSSQPVQPADVRALQLSAGPADESLVNALKDFLQDVQGVENDVTRLEEEGLNPEIDEMGQTSYHDEAGDAVGDTYYGWSRSFCEKMKKRGRSDSDASTRSRSSSRTRSRSRSLTPHQGRRRSEWRDGRSRSPRSDSRSSSRSRRGGTRRQRIRSRSRTSSSSSAANRPQFRQPPPVEPPKPLGNTSVQTPLPPPPPPPPPPSTLPFQPPPFHSIGAPGLPPKPPQWTGPWPPPPPPPPSYAQSNPGFRGLPFPPPPPNFPPPHGGWPYQSGDQPGGRNGYPGRR